MLQSDLLGILSHVNTVLIIDIHKRHRIAVDRNNGNRFIMRIHDCQKHCVSLSAAQTVFCLFYNIVIVNTHDEKCHDIFVVGIDLTIIADPSILPALFG